MRLFTILSLSVLFIACSSTKGPDPNNGSNEPNAISISEADRFWTQREDVASANRALNAYQQLSELDTNSIVIAAKLSRAYYYHGQFLESKRTKKDSLFMLGHETCQSILKKDKDYYNLLYSTGDEQMAIQGLNGEYLDALYWGMANYGQWLATKGDLVRIGQRDLIWGMLEHVRTLDSNYYHGAYYRFKGALLALDPEFQSDTLAIREAFDAAIEIAPDYLGNYTLMAMYYCPLTGDKDLFYQLLTQVITSTPNAELPYHAENSHEKQVAENLMVRAEQENWF